MKEARVLIVDDEALARERVRTLLSSAPGVTVVGECSGGREAVEAIIAERPDLVFLDVQMPDLNGFEVLEAAQPEWLPAVVFVTAYDEYALKAFEVHAIDYLLKPVEPERFRTALARARAPKPSLTGNARRAPARAPRDSRARQDSVRKARRHRLDRSRRQARAAARGREAHAVRIPLKRLEQRLGAHGFVRVHRSAIVNVERIKELEPWFHGEYVVVLKDGTKLTSSAAHSQALHRIIDAS